jgi:hypothetical protein
LVVVFSRADDSKRKLLPLICAAIAKALIVLTEGTDFEVTV